MSASIVTQQVALTGLAPVSAPATGAGDTVQPSPHTFLEVNNTGGAPTTVTIITPGNDQFGQPLADLVVTVPAAGRKLIGPLNQALAATSGANVGLIPVTYSVATGVTVNAIAA